MDKTVAVALVVLLGAALVAVAVAGTMRINAGAGSRALAAESSIEGKILLANMERDEDACGGVMLAVKNVGAVNITRAGNPDVWLAQITFQNGSVMTVDVEGVFKREGGAMVELSEDDALEPDQTIYLCLAASNVTGAEYFTVVGPQGIKGVGHFDEETLAAVSEGGGGGGGATPSGPVVVNIRIWFHSADVHPAAHVQWGGQQLGGLGSYEVKAGALYIDDFIFPGDSALGTCGWYNEIVDARCGGTADTQVFQAYSSSAGGMTASFTKNGETVFFGNLFSGDYIDADMNGGGLVMVYAYVEVDGWAATGGITLYDPDTGDTLVDIVLDDSTVSLVAEAFSITQVDVSHDSGSGIAFVWLQGYVDSLDLVVDGETIWTSGGGPQ